MGAVALNPPEKAHPLPEGAMRVEGMVIDRDGNPLVDCEGCPNCGEGGGWQWAGLAEIFGRQPCSRACRLQIEYAETKGIMPS